jgi:hypothetical protein
MMRQRKAHLARPFAAHEEKVKQGAKEKVSNGKRAGNRFPHVESFRRKTFLTRCPLDTFSGRARRSIKQGQGGPPDSQEVVGVKVGAADQGTVMWRSHSQSI